MNRKERVTIPCEVCATPVTRLLCQIKGRVFCSKACLGAWHRHGSELCDEKFYRRLGEQDIGTRVNQFCSRDCYMQWRQTGARSYLKTGARHTHRVVVETHIGRALTSAEVVHHIDLNRQNNSLSNLMLFPDSRTHMLCHWGRLTDAELRSFLVV